MNFWPEQSPANAMMKLIQTFCLAAYRGVAATGLFETAFGKSLFIALYDLYKNRVEAGDADALRAWVKPGQAIIDVGANIGFFTVRFARWTESGGRVIAIEPEAQNLLLLRRRLEKAGVATSVDVIEGVAADAPGTLHLVLNPHHPADHRIGASGVPVRAWTVDEIMEARGWPEVSLIKIDVQGAEIRVLRGAQATLTRFHPVLFVEVDDRALRDGGFSADMLFDEIEGHGYRAYDLGSPDRPLSRTEAAARRQALGYADYLFRVGPASRGGAEGIGQTR
jgi:FkbM family methyltransferase